MNKTLEEIKKRFEKKFVDQVMTPQGGREVWEWVESTISQTKQEEENIDWNIDVRYEKDLETAFNKFIEKWCKSNFPHLIDNDENDGEFIRMKIRKLQRKAKSASQTKHELIEDIKKHIENELILLDINHGENKMKGGWISFEDLNDFLQKLSNK